MIDQPELASHQQLGHQQLGQQLGIYEPHELAGAGFPLWLPNGAAIVAELERYIVDTERRAGYVHVRTPPVAKPELYRRSGHADHFLAEMFPPMRIGGDELVLRPTLCPHHALVFGSRLRSHRELPLRLAEFGQQFRKEPSGVVEGLLRVRGMTLNDAHVFCGEEQAAAEAALALEMIDEAYQVLGIEPAYVMLSVRGPGKSYAGSDEIWERAEAILLAALAARGMEAKRVEGEAAFYGPKLDIQVYDAHGKEFTLSTVQADLVQPERFDLKYVAPSGARLRPAIVHRSVLSAMERMVAYLLERSQGVLPPWLAPVQVLVLPVGAEQSDAAWRFAALAAEAGVRVEVDDRDETLGARIRSARPRRVPYLAVFGGREVADGAVAVRLRDGSQLSPLPVAAFLQRLGRVLRSRARDLDLN